MVLSQVWLPLARASPMLRRRQRGIAAPRESLGPLNLVNPSRKAFPCHRQRSRGMPRSPQRVWDLRGTPLGPQRGLLVAHRAPPHGTGHGRSGCPTRSRACPGGSIPAHQFYCDGNEFPDGIVRGPEPCCVRRIANI